MISNICNSIINRPITNCKLSPSFKCAKGMDVFEKSDSMRDSKMEGNRYSQVDRNINIDDIENSLNNTSINESNNQHNSTEEDNIQQATSNNYTVNEDGSQQ